jgi:DNA-binding LacI/PurR family transcriptional regulator
VIGVMLSDFRNPFFTDVIDGISTAAREAQYRALFNTGDLSGSGETVAIETLLQLRVDGLILAGTVVDAETIERVAADVPLVLASRKSPTELADSVVTDDVAGAGLAVDHLVTLGHRRIAHITGGDGAGAADRSRGFEAAMARHGLGAGTTVVTGDFTEAGGIVGMKQILTLASRPTAVFVANDQAAIGALRALSEAGLGVPLDMSLIGYDDTYLAAFEHINLTSIHQEPEQMGREAVRLLLERTDGQRSEPRQVTLMPRLTVRDSTAAPTVGDPV